MKANGGNEKCLSEDIDQLQNIMGEDIKRRRIVNVNYFWKELQEQLSVHGPQKETKCSLKDWSLERESNFHGGLRTLFHFKCKRCHRECQVWSEEVTDEDLDLNTCSVWGTLAEGFGYSQMSGLFACMGIPYSTNKSYKRNQEKLLDKLNELSAASMKKAGEEELELAKKHGDVDENGIPFITVIVDGSWIKRSFGTKYDSLSGLGVIIGKRTGKVLCVGVKNKFCTACH